MQLRGNYNYFVVADWIDLAIDVLLTGLILLFVLGIAPAMYRRNRRSKKGGYPSEGTLPLSKYFGMALTVSFLAAAIGISNPTDEFTAVPSGTQVNFSIPPLNPTDKFTGVPEGTAHAECRPMGADELCAEVIYEGNKKVSYSATFKYSTEKVMSGEYFSKLTWNTRVDCSDKTGTVLNLDAFNSNDKIVEIGEVKTQMIDGINKSVIPNLINAICKQ